jgi:ESS family glutamate:Na+ symporter
MTLDLDVRVTTIAAILVVFLGAWLTGRVRFLAAYNIPEPVSGGLAVAVALALLQFSGVTVSLHTDLRDALLLVFFSTVGLASRVKLLLAGGRALVVLAAAAAVTVLLQNLLGVGLAWLLGQDPRFGLIAGSISMSGGHGTAIAWSRPLQEAGMSGALEFGVAAATLGLVAGGLLGGPIGGRLIRRGALQPAHIEGAGDSLGQNLAQPQLHITPVRAMRALLVLAITVGLGLGLHGVLVETGLTLPAFVCCLFAGILVTNVAQPLFAHIEPWPGNGPTLALIAQISLNLFLAMSMMSINVATLAGLALPLVIIVAAQVAMVSLLLAPLVFRLLGRDFDAAVMSGGFTGLSLGATPTAIANMTALTSAYGPSPRAFIVVPLVGAFLIDLVNAVVVNLGMTLVSP